jgi:RND family efflux transporter MFP subunit
MLLLVSQEEHPVKKAVLIILVIGVAATLVVRAAIHDKNSDGQGVQSVRAIRCDIGSVVKATGVVKPPVGAEVRVGAQVSGLLKRIHVRIGDPVTKGQLLAEIKVGELEARRDQAKAALQSAQANRAFGASDLARKRKLAEENVLAQSELEVAERSFNLAQAAVAEARANLAFAQTQLGEARIIAPMSGVVAQVTMREGETVAAGLSAPTFLTIIDLQKLEVWAYVDETDIGRVQIGQKARFSVDAYPGQEFEGQITAIYPKPEIRDNVVNYIAVLRFTPPRQQILRPEMTANIKIALDSRANVLAVPRRAIRRENGRPFVLCQQNGAVVRRQVTTGSRDETNWEIVEGLREGEQVLVGDVPADGTAK